MREQLTLLRDTDWDVLVILDACRADAFRNVAQPPPAVEAVRSPAPCTEAWISRVGPHLAGLDVTYFSANPVVERTVQARSMMLCTEPIWDKLWGRFTDLQIPSVHPLSVTAVAVDACCPLPSAGCRCVVHYLQPHSPYIGAVPLNLCRWGRGKHPLISGCHALARPDHEVEAGRLTWPEVRDAYLANLSLVWEAVRMLAGALPDKRFVVTSDHGEMLGEDGGKFGHECNWRNDELFEVPWLEATGAEIAGAEQATTMQKLEALGYV